MNIPHTFTDCGRSANETNDCSVRALAHVLGVEYGQAHAMLAEIGRKDRHGLKHKHFIRNLDRLGLEQRPDLSCMTLARALPLMASGRFMCWVHRHFFTVIDGVVFDTWEQRPGRRLKMVYQKIETK